MISIRRKYLTDIYLDRLVVVWMLLSVVIIGFFGIKPLWKEISDKRAVLGEMKDLNKKLENNFRILDDIGQDLLKAGNRLQYLYQYMPAEPDIHNYLLDFVTGTSSVGFTLLKYNPYVVYSETDGNLGSIEIRTKLKGTGDLVDLAKSIEDLKRITTIKQVKYAESKTSKDMYLDVDLEIYYMKEP